MFEREEAVLKAINEIFLLGAFTGENFFY